MIPASRPAFCHRQPGNAFDGHKGSFTRLLPEALFEQPHDPGSGRPAGSRYPAGLGRRSFQPSREPEPKSHKATRKIPFSKDQFRLMRIKTVKDSRSLTLIFPLPATQKYYRSRPLNMLGFLVGHEGKGSLLSLLKEEGLASGLSAGGGDSTSSYTSFNINIQLTPKGLKRYTKVIERTFQYLRLLREKVFHDMFTRRSAGWQRSTIGLQKKLEAHDWSTCFHC